MMILQILLMTILQMTILQSLLMSLLACIVTVRRRPPTTKKELK